MKFLLAALNAKYIHSNPGIYSLKAYAEAHGKEPELLDGRFEIEIGEYTINNQLEDSTHFMVDVSTVWLNTNRNNFST